MKNFYKRLFILTAIISASIMSAQMDTLLKKVINKNNFAIRSIQKQCLVTPQLFETAAIKDLLKYQVISVDFYSSENEISKASAYALRKKCLEFISVNIPNQLAVYNLTRNEENYFSSSTDLKNLDTHLDKNKLKSINAVDENNPYLFNDFSLSLK